MQSFIFKWHLVFELCWAKHNGQWMSLCLLFFCCTKFDNLFDLLHLFDNLVLFKNIEKIFLLISWGIVGTDIIEKTVHRLFLIEEAIFFEKGIYIYIYIYMYIICIYIYYIYIYKTNKWINNQLQTRWSMTDAISYSSKNIYIHQKRQRVPKSFNNKT